MEFKTQVVEKLYKKMQELPTDLKTAPKDFRTISLAEIIDNKTTESVEDIIEDIKDAASHGTALADRTGGDLQFPVRGRNRFKVGSIVTSVIFG